ncbi:MAG: hypothetical protein COX79_00315 [Candidatus Levybacteria bacterium CG_4_10_14_0_2_um_filter_36_16]|nr:MAG: hypothetical protein COX79_00315 [Candidatus Levybacteria bacterium CG_4_10_14_0_2_um_filter_36_16]PJA90067.1 MAG: hypothetical protein CO136_03280 [Candidatus Levybacteria bacterium CG_4_9_14_3_um_filter_36_7]
MEQIPNSVQSWHHHEKIWETLYVIEGVLIMRWKEGETLKEDIIKAGDLIETERTPHTLINNTNNLAKFIVIKQILKGENFSELLKTDKIVHHQK